MIEVVFVKGSTLSVCQMRLNHRRNVTAVESPILQLSYMPCVTMFPSTKKRVENMICSEVFLMDF